MSHSKKIFSALCIVFTVFALTFSSTILLARTKAVNAELDLLGKRIYVDPGHGGLDNGANYLDIVEDEINLAISLQLLEQLVEHGALCEISRTGDYDLASMYASNRKREDLRKRLDAIKMFSPDFFISIHVNSYPSSNVRGGQVFFRNNDKTSAELASIIQDQFNKLNNTDKEIKESDFYFFEHSSTKGILIEVGFITNNSDRKKLLDQDYQITLAKTIIAGLVNYFSMI